LKLMNLFRRRVPKKVIYSAMRIVSESKQIGSVWLRRDTEVEVPLFALLVRPVSTFLLVGLCRSCCDGRGANRQTDFESNGQEQRLYLPMGLELIAAVVVVVDYFEY
jgi:hypothetical protein